jgi:TolA-binding protein
VDKKETRQPADRGEAFLQWMKQHQRALIIAGAVVVVIAGGIWFTIAAKERKNSLAMQALDEARTAAQAGNLPLAASDFSRLVSRYPGTNAAGEASLLLGQIHLLQNQPKDAATELRKYIASGPPTQYVSEAHELLGSALEETGDLKGAAQEYEQAAKTSYYKLVQADLWIRAGRAYQMAKDTAAAITAYQKVVKDYSNTGSMAEAQLRLAELGRFDTQG